MKRRVIKFLLFWSGVLVGLAPGLIGALDNRAGDRLYATLFQLLVMIVIQIALYVPAKTLGMRAKRPLPGLFVGLAAGACFVIDSLLVSLLVTFVDTVSSANRWLPEIHALHIPILYINAVIGAVVFLLMAIPVGMGAGLLLSLGFGLDLAPLIQRNMPTITICEDKLRFPALRPYTEHIERVVVTFTLRWRREIVFGLVLFFGLLVGPGAGIKAAQGHGFLVPHHNGLGVGMLEGIVVFLYAPAVAIGVWCANGPGNWLRTALVTFVELAKLATFRERAQSRVSAKGSFLTALLTGYVLTVACFAGLYAIAYLFDKSGAFVDQNIQAAPGIQKIQIGDLTMLSMSTLAGGSGSELQPSSSLARGLFLFQVAINYAWTGGILLTAVSQALDTKGKRPDIVVTSMVTPTSPAAGVVHIHIHAPLPQDSSAKTTPAPASTMPTSQPPKNNYKGWRSIIVVVAAIAHLLRGVWR